MPRRPRLVGAALAVLLAGACSRAPAPGRQPVRPPTSRPDPAAATNPPAPTNQPPEAATTTTPTGGSDPAAIAARFAVAYLQSPPGGTAKDRRRRCRPFDTDTLDQDLAAPAWDGQTINPPPGLGGPVIIDAVNPVERDAHGVGYELTATLDTSAGSQQTGGRVDMQLWLTPTGGGGWAVAQVSVT